MQRAKKSTAVVVRARPKPASGDDDPDQNQNEVELEPIEPTEDGDHPEVEAEPEEKPTRATKQAAKSTKPKPTKAKVVSQKAESKKRPLKIQEEDEEEEEDPELSRPFSSDPKKAEQERKYRERLKQAKKLRAVTQIAEPKQIDMKNVTQRDSESIWLKDFKPELVTLGDAANKTDPQRAMYYFDHCYGDGFPTIQFEGKLAFTPLPNEMGGGGIDFVVEVSDPEEQRILFEWNDRIEKLFLAKSLEKKWEFVSDDEIRPKLKYKAIIARQNAVDPSVRKRFPKHKLPKDLIDPMTGKKIKCFDPYFKCSLKMHPDSKEFGTDIMDKNDVEMHPLDFRAGNRVRISASASYGYYKALADDPAYGVPRKILLLKQLTSDETPSRGQSKAKRTRWAAGTDNQANPTNSNPDAGSVSAPTNQGPATTSTESKLSAAAYRARIQQQATLQADKPTASASSEQKPEKVKAEKDKAEKDQKPEKIDSKPAHSASEPKEKTDKPPQMPLPSDAKEKHEPAKPKA
jgi:hypothetical protein